MGWRVRWAFWRGRAGRPESPAVGAGSRGLEAWEAQLVEHGVSSSLAPRIAARLAPLQRELGRGSAEALRRAALAVYEVHSATHADVERQLRDVREVERLLGAFSGELEKLDEVLEVLTAYAQRLRSQPGRKPRQTLH